ncbi:MAG: MarR family transcriptional regulator [Candidatus Hodarchaeota archaeon]
MPIPKSTNKYKLKSLPPATIAVLNELSPGKPMTALELKEKTGYSIRTIRYSLKSLHKRKIVEKRLNLLDMRITEYAISSISTMVSRQGQEETRDSRIRTAKLKSEMTKSHGVK